MESEPVDLVTFWLVMNKDMKYHCKSFSTYTFPIIYQRGKHLDPDSGHPW